MTWLDSITDWMDKYLCTLQDMDVEDRGAWRATVHGVRKNQTWLSNWTTSWHLPVTSTKIKLCAAETAGFQHSWKELRMESGNKALCAGGGETGKTHLQIARDFQESIYEHNSCITSYLEKHQNPSWWWFSFMHSRSFWKNMCLTACTLPSPKSHIYCSSPSTSSEQFLRAIWGSVSWAAVFILPQIKLNLQLSRCAFLKSWQ